ncbi:MarR family winged helix-turn-helix transcriptional regulator [Zhongshania borealis]|uniref:MarR family transcriptional regulator n=1 Tax=Zhongshania borealis TaxID=889488 RepID=A0ABP7X389_9GAMM|tara:strand:- start:1337 stop:1831 length:495 start_codon:yes stop_codon:yes gene_type:complete
MDDKRISIKELRQQQARHWPEMHRASNPAILNIVRAGDRFIKETNAALQIYQLTGAEFDVLATLRRQEQPYQLSPTELCKAMLFSSGGLTKVLYRLQNARLILRPENPNDGRSLLVQLSPEGITLTGKLCATIAALHEKRIAKLSSAEQATLSQLLEKAFADEN